MHKEQKTETGSAEGLGKPYKNNSLGSYQHFLITPGNPQEHKFRNEIKNRQYQLKNAKLTTTPEPRAG